MKSIIYLLEEHPTQLPFVDIVNAVDNFKGRLANVFEFDFGEAGVDKRLGNIAGLTNTPAHREKMKRTLEGLVKDLSEVLNRQTKLYNQSVGLYPLPTKFFP